MIQFLHWLRAHPRRLFLIDGAGALWSVFVSGVLLVMLQAYVGIPLQALYLLAGIPLIFLIFDLYAYSTFPNHTGAKLYTIGMLNGIYCLLSAALLLMHRGDILWPGMLYLIVEIAVVAGIACLEIRMASRALSPPVPHNRER
ncbi:MAG: hypothetical protein WA952_08100 [Lewinella sp.]